jgi:hypothetical protein
MKIHAAIPHILYINNPLLSSEMLANGWLQEWPLTLNSASRTTNLKINIAISRRYNTQFL